MTTIQVAVAQAAGGFDLEATLTRVDQLISDSVSRGARLVVLPEAFIGGYPKGADFGVRVGTRSPGGREVFERYYEAAIDVPGPAVKRLGEIARDHRTHVVIGVIERDGGTLYCSALFFGADGALLGKHRKLVPTAMERVIWGRGDGSTLTAVDTPVGRLGAAICWENYMPLFRTAMYAKGVQLWCAPTVDDRDVWLPSMRFIATEGRCFVLSACQFATRADYPDDFETSFGNDPDAVLIRGGSCIVDPFGEVLAGPVYGESTVLVADVDLGKIARGKYDLDVTGHYGRPDVFDLRVDEREQGVGFGGEER